MNTPVYIVNYYYTEEYCSPNPDVWENRNKVLMVTTDIELARKCRDEHNSKPWYERVGEIATIDEYVMA